MTSGERPAVVQAGMVEFGDAEARPDTLDGVVAEGTSPNSAFSTGNYLIDNMQKLGEAVVETLSTVYSRYSPDRGLEGEQKYVLKGVQNFIPYIISLDIPADYSGVTQVSLAQAPSGIVRTFLEHRFGEDIRETGIYEAVGLGLDDLGEKIAVEKLVKYVPEMEVLVKLDKKFVLIVDNPYQSLLSLPVEVRAFFTGALDKKKAERSAKRTTSFIKPLTLMDILSYARDVGEVSKVRTYMDVYNAI